VGALNHSVFMQIDNRKGGTTKEDWGKSMRKVSQITLVLGLTFMAFLVTCIVVAGQDVRTNYMPGTNFGKYKTYKWVVVEGGVHPNQIVDAEIKEAVDSQLASKGMTKTDGENADLYVGYQIAVDQEKQWNAWGSGGRVMGGMGSATSSTISVGTLVLDMHDPSSKQLVWTGNASKTIAPKGSQEKNEKNLNKAMAKLLKNFPPK
jgi:hypothetical protein